MEENNQNKEVTKNSKEKKNKNSKKIIGVVFTIVAVVIVAVVIVAACLRLSTPTSTENPNNNQNPTFDLTEDENAQEGQIEGKSQEEIRDELNKKVAEGMINISMNMNPIFEDGTSEGNLLIMNEDVNIYPQIVEIYRDDTDELIYRSGGIPVGSRVERGYLAVDLDAGEYDCTAYFNAVNPDTNQLMGKAGAKISITVLN